MVFKGAPCSLMELLVRLTGWFLKILPRMCWGWWGLGVHHFRSCSQIMSAQKGGVQNAPPPLAANVRISPTPPLPLSATVSICPTSPLLQCQFCKHIQYHPLPEWHKKRKIQYLIKKETVPSLTSYMGKKTVSVLAHSFVMPQRFNSGYKLSIHPLRYSRI